LNETHKGVKQIGQKPCYKEGQQYTGKGVEQPYGSNCKAKDCDSTDKTVESYLLFKHLIKLKIEN
jgi:hypothetical protein